MDVASVPRGLKCGCVCPSCKIPLVARHGDINEWHFAHASRNDQSRVERECDFSFYVSVRMMARQMIGRDLTLALPALGGAVEAQIGYEGPMRVDFRVTEARSITLTDVLVDQNFSGVTVDVVGRVGDYVFVLYFVHPERQVPTALRSPSDARSGVVAISLEPLSSLFREARRGNRSYEDVLREYLHQNIASKTWVYHPLYRSRQAEAQAALDERIRNAESESRFRPASPVRGQSARFECALCAAVWQGIEPTDRDCPRCQTHLYTRVLPLLKADP